VIYLDNAATSFPKPEGVYRAVDEVTRCTGNPGRAGHALARRAEAEIEGVRVRAARFFGTRWPERVIFTLNATDALNMAIKGFLQAGDHVVTTSLEHNSVSRPLAALARRGISFAKVGCDTEGRVDVESLKAAVMPRTRLVVLTWVSNVWGTVQPVEAVAEMCRRHGVKLLVDAAQAAGHVRIDMQAMGIDMLACSGHKGLLGPPGTGLLVLGADVDLLPWREGGTGVVSHQVSQPDFYPQRLESGTPNTAGIAGLGAGIDFLNQVGLPEVIGHESCLLGALREGLAAIPSVRVYGPARAADQTSLLSFNVEGWDPMEVAAVLDQSFGISCRAGLHCAPWAHQALGTYPTGTVRFSVGYFNTAGEIEQAIQAVRALAGAGR